MKINLSIVAANAAADAIAKQLDGGFIEVYDGDQPLSGDAPLPDGTKLLAVMQLGIPAFGPASGGVARALQVTPDRDAKNTGKPRWFRLYKADHRSSVYDGDITADAKGAMQIRALSIGKHAEVYCDSCVIRMPLKG